jgi:hypothetical protein
LGKPLLMPIQTAVKQYISVFCQATQSFFSNTEYGKPLGSDSDSSNYVDNRADEPLRLFRVDLT